MTIGPVRYGIAAAMAIALAIPLVGCASTSHDASEKPAASSATPATLTVYTDQHAELIASLTKAYTDKTGVKFRIQEGATVGQIQAEGKASPADVFLSEDPGPAAQLSGQKLLVPISKSTLNHVRPALNPEDGMWVAYAARARVLYYNPTIIDEADLPKTLLEIVQPEYKGKFAWAPSGAFVATTQYLISTIGVDKTRTFLEAIKANGVNEQKNGNVRDTVEAGKHAMGLSNHYYWWIKAAEVGGPDKMVSKIYHFPQADAGNLILSSGAGILKTSTHQKAAAAFLSWLTDKSGGQKILAGAGIDSTEAQYPAALGVVSTISGDLGAIKSPKYDMGIYADQTEAQDLLKSLGLSS
ncbi:MAG: extracellular solute-binding protein [Lacisediminihabitans sp.]